MSELLFAVFFTVGVSMTGGSVFWYAINWINGDPLPFSLGWRVKRQNAKLKQQKAMLALQQENDRMLQEITRMSREVQ